MKLALAFLLTLSGGQAPSPVLPLWAGLTPGQYAVGVRSTDKLTTWYPATQGGEIVRFRDYVPLLEDLDAFLHAQHTPDETIVELFDSRMYARRDAPKIEGKFPLVLIAQGNGNSANDQAILAEFIASHGYIVATIAGPIVKSETEIASKAQEQAEAFEAVVKTLGADEVVIIGHSFGARSMLLYATRNPVKALVSLDGGGMGAATNTPTLHLYGDMFIKPAPNVKVEKVDAMHHVHFSSWGFISAAFPDIAKATKATRGTKRGVTSSAQRTLEFIAAETSRPPI